MLTNTLIIGKRAGLRAAFREHDDPSSDSRRHQGQGPQGASENAL